MNDNNDDFMLKPDEQPNTTDLEQKSAESDTQVEEPTTEPAPVDPLDELDSEPSTQPDQPIEQPFASPPGAPPAKSDDQTTDSNTTQPEQRPNQPAANNYSRSTDNLKQPGSKRSKRQKQPKAPKVPKQPKQPKQRKQKNPNSSNAPKVVLTVLLTIIILAAIAGALWYFVFQPKPDDTISQEPVTDTVKPVESTPANSAELIVAAVQESLHEELDELYEDMVITPSSPDSTEPAISPSFQVEGADYAVTTTQTYGLTVLSSKDAKPETVDQNFTKQVEKTTAATLVSNTYKVTQKDTQFGTIYETDDVICSLFDNTNITCADKSSYKSASDAIKPFAEAFASENTDKEFGKPIFSNNPKTQDSQTAGYETAEVPMSNSVGLFYRKTGDKWHYFTNTQSIMNCSTFAADEVKAAFAGQQCIDPNINQDTNKPTTVGEFNAKKDTK